MRIRIKTFVEQDFRNVFAQFDRTLFLRLAPPFPPVRLERFDGCAVGDVVILELNFIFFKQKWESLITENQQTETEFFFVDEGKKLPFFLKKWRHKHRIVQNGQQSCIIDDIEYHTPFGWMDYVMFPLLYGQFYYRKPVYKRFFRKKRVKV